MKHHERAITFHPFVKVYLLGLLVTLTSCSGKATEAQTKTNVSQTDSSLPINLTKSSESEQAPRWSPDGKKIAFSVNNSEIYVMNADGSRTTNLTKNPALDDFEGLGNSVWSPDGKKIAFQSTRDGNQEIYVMNADGSNPTRLTNNSAKDTHAVWSPDGKKIAFYSERDGNDEIYVMNADGSQQTRLTKNSVPDSFPDWSPDGKQLVFTRYDGNSQIYVMKADGSQQTRLTTTNTPGGDGSPAWSPDGQKIAFSSFRNEKSEAYRDGNGDIYVMNADGSEQTQLTNNLADDASPFWSPDGKRIAFISSRDKSYHQIYVMNADGSQQTGLTNNEWESLHPAWSPDSKHLAYTHSSQSNEIYRINVDGFLQARQTKNPSP